MKFNTNKFFLALCYLVSSVCLLFPNISHAEIIPTVDEQVEIIGKPTNQIKIPGLSYTEVKKIEEGDGTYLYIPFLGEYLGVIYRYLVVIAGLVATIVIIVSGIQWTASGGNSSTIESAKNRIIGALTGLGLAVGSYVILYTINPELVNFKNLKIKYITSMALMGGDHAYPVDEENQEEFEEVAKNTPTGAAVGGWNANCDEASTQLKENKQKQNTINATIKAYKTELKKNKGNEKTDTTLATYNKEKSTYVKEFYRLYGGPAISCRNKAIAELPPENRSKASASSKLPQYSNKYLGQIDAIPGKRRSLDDIKYIGIHEGGPDGGIGTWWINYLQQGKLSGTHYFVMQDGTIYQVKDETLYAFHGVKNDESIGIDLQGAKGCGSGTFLSNDKIDQICRYSPAQIASLQALIRDIMTRTKVTFDDQHILGHCQSPHGTHGDPRNFDWRKIGLSNAAHKTNPKCYFPFP